MRVRVPRISPSNSGRTRANGRRPAETPPAARPPSGTSSKVPGAVPRPPSLLYVRGARYQLCGVEARYDAPLNCLRRQSITLYVRAREYARCVWRSIDGPSFFLSNSTGDRSYARSPFVVPLVGVAKSFRRRRSAKSRDTITRTRHDHRCC